MRELIMRYALAVAAVLCGFAHAAGYQLLTCAAGGGYRVWLCDTAGQAPAAPIPFLGSGDYTSGGFGDMAIGPDGNLYVCSSLSGAVLRFNAHTGQFIDKFVTSGPPRGQSLSPTSISFGPDGSLYVGIAQGSIYRYNSRTGGYLGYVTPLFADRSLSIDSMEFGPDGRLYVSNGAALGAIDTSTNQSTVLASFDVDGQSSAASLGDFTFGPDGNIYAPIATITNRLAFGTTEARIEVRKLDPVHGDDLGLFCKSGETFNWTRTKPFQYGSAKFGPDGDFYVGYPATYLATRQQQIIRYDGLSGAFKDVAVAERGGYILFIPEPVTVLMLAAGFCLVQKRR